MKTKRRMRRVGVVGLRAAEREREDYATVHARSGGQCEVVLDGTRCHRARMPGVHHVTKRGRGGKFKGPDHIMDICYPHHDLTDNASVTQRTTLPDGTTVRGKLDIIALGNGSFACAFVSRAKRPSASEAS